MEIPAERVFVEVGSQEAEAQFLEKNVLAVPPHVLTNVRAPP